MTLPPKAQSTNSQGEADGFIPTATWKAQTLPGGYTRLQISSPPHKLEILHQALAEKLSFPCKIRYVRLTDRQLGQLPNPESYVAVNVSSARLMQALKDFSNLFYHDGRNQIWILGASQEQIILDELGML